MRLATEISNLGQEPGKKIEGKDIPVKMIIAGPAEAGKTTLLQSIFDYLSRNYITEVCKPLWSIVSWARGFWEGDHISEDQKERTIGLTIHSKRLFDEMLFLIYDLGGQECYYALQAVFLDLENAFFFVVVDLTDSDELLKDNIEKQLSIISSKLPKYAKAEIILVGTHLDLINDAEKEKKANICEKALLAADCPNVEIVKEIFINATKQNSKQLLEIIESCKELGENVQKAMVSHLKVYFNEIKKCFSSFFLLIHQVLIYLFSTLQ